MKLTVVIPTHNPSLERLFRTLDGLRSQTLPAHEWQTLVVDNASMPALSVDLLANRAPQNFRLVAEPRLGLTSARRRGFREASAPLCVLVDDDNVLASDYLEQVARLFAAYPRIGALGGRSLPEFETEPPAWTREFYPLLALRDFGDQPTIAASLTTGGTTIRAYPSAAAPIGAGMALRLVAIQAWLDEGLATQLPDRRGEVLTSGGDNDIVFALLRRGWHVGYFPELSLTHLIPSARLAPGYLARINAGIQHSWMQVLTKNCANPWPRISRWSLPLRQLKAWFTFHGWSYPVGYIRWRGACGHFAGRTSSLAGRIN